ncbi:MAG: hypothetical protein K0S11_1110 [Gammaproteobacteria bacterium]|jgi:hypothetical protein|nr:hypothetical protein [Gammaproteobacteria bacterium]
MHNTSAATVKTIPAHLKFENIAVGSNINLTLTSGDVGWSIGPDVPYSVGLNLNIEDKMLRCIASLEVNYSVLAITTVSPTNQQGLVSFSLSLFLQVTNNATSLKGHATLNEEATIYPDINGVTESSWLNGVFEATWPLSEERRRRS